MTAIKGFLETSFLDWPGCLCAVVFLGGCNFRCPFCHNHPLVLEPQELATVPLDHLLARLAAMRPWLGGVCVSGGEPTLAPDLADLLRIFKSSGIPVKLDTNGSRPEVLEALLAEGLLAMIAMDVKAPLDQAKYDACAGTGVDLAAIHRSIALIRESGLPHQFRMTVLPRLHSEEDIRAWRETLAGSPLTLQNFDPRSPLAGALRREKGFAPEVFARLQALIA